MLIRTCCGVTLTTRESPHVRVRRTSFCAGRRQCAAERRRTGGMVAGVCAKRCGGSELHRNSDRAQHHHICCCSGAGAVVGDRRRWCIVLRPDCQRHVHDPSRRPQRCGSVRHTHHRSLPACRYAVAALAGRSRPGSSLARACCPSPYLLAPLAGQTLTSSVSAPAKPSRFIRGPPRSSLASLLRSVGS